MSKKPFWPVSARGWLELLAAVVATAVALYADLKWLGPVAGGAALVIWAVLVVIGVVLYQRARKKKLQRAASR